MKMKWIEEADQAGGRLAKDVRRMHYSEEQQAY